MSMVMNAVDEPQQDGEREKGAAYKLQAFNI